MQLSADIETYLVSQRATLESGAYWNCLIAATTLAGLLLGQGLSPWIGRLRKREDRDGAQIHWPLIPRRPLRGRSWTTHYVCVADSIVFDPVGGQPIPLADYARRVFGEELPIEIHLSQSELVDHLASQRPAGVP